MLIFLLKKIRLTVFFWIVFILFMLLFLVLPVYTFSSAALTLFSVNSFLYGFYISPILAGQKARIEELHKIVRSEANALFQVQLKTKKLDGKLRTVVQQLVQDYTHARVTNKGDNHGEAEYEKAIGYCLTYEGNQQKAIDTILDGLVANQQNRTQLSMQLSNKVYSNEWLLMSVLFSITTSIIMLIDVDDILVLTVIKALLCTALTMLVIVLLKLSTLTHKKAQEIWKPLEKLLKTHFYQID